jgi:hypothetical protein
MKVKENLEISVLPIVEGIPPPFSSTAPLSREDYLQKDADYAQC